MAYGNKEGLTVARFMMVLSSISPLFILWAIRGNKVLSNTLFSVLCAALVLVPNTVLWLRIRTAKIENDVRDLEIGRSEDHRDHLLVYLIAILLPFYSANLATPREFLAAVLAICFIVFLFWYMNLHYMNLAFAVLGYRIFTVYPAADENPRTGTVSFVVITRRSALEAGQQMFAFRISNTVFLEKEK